MYFHNAAGRLFWILAEETFILSIHYLGILRHSGQGFIPAGVIRYRERGRSGKPMKSCLHFGFFISMLALAFPLRAAECTAVPGVLTPLAPQQAFLRAYRHELSSPTRLAIDATGSVFIADPQKGEVLVRAHDGRILQHRRGLGRPGAVAVDSANNVYLADLDSGLVSVFDSSWQLSHQFGGTDLQQAGDIAIDDARSRVYISDSKAHTVRIYSTAGERLFEFGGEGDGDGQFQYPSGVFYDAVNDEVLVSDQLGYRVQVFEPDGAYKYCVGGSSANPGGIFQGGRLLASPQGLWADALGRIYVADSFEGQVKVIDRSGRLLASIGSFGQSGGELRIPSDVVLDGFGRLFVASANNARVEMFGIDGFTDPEQYTPALLSIDPDRVRADSSGVLNVLITTPGLRLSDIQNDSIRLNGIPNSSIQTVDVDGDAEPELFAGFDLGAVLATLPPSGTALVRLQAATQTILIDGSASIEIIPADSDQDLDNDGVNDDQDRCPDTAPDALVDATGCALSQYCVCADFSSHGAYVECIAKTSRRFVLDGLMDKKHRNQAIRDAARSACGKGSGHAEKQHHHEYEDDGDARERDHDESGTDDHEQADHTDGKRRHRK